MSTGYLAGNRRFCNPNPRWVGPAPRSQVRHKRRAQQYWDGREPCFGRTLGRKWDRKWGAMFCWLEFSLSSSWPIQAPHWPAKGPGAPFAISAQIFPRTVSTVPWRNAAWRSFPGSAGSATSILAGKANRSGRGRTGEA